MSDNLLTSQVPRTLEGKSKLFGFELSDVLLLFSNLTIQNLFFGTTNLKTPLVWGTTLILGFILFFVKRGKPDKYLEHLGLYLFSSTIRFAAVSDRKYKKFRGVR